MTPARPDSLLPLAEQIARRMAVTSTGFDATEWLLVAVFIDLERRKLSQNGETTHNTPKPITRSVT